MSELSSIEQILITPTEDLEKMILEYYDKSEKTIGLLVILLELKRREIMQKNRPANYDE